MSRGRLSALFIWLFLRVPSYLSAPDVSHLEPHPHVYISQVSQSVFDIVANLCLSVPYLPMSPAPVIKIPNLGGLNYHLLLCPAFEPSTPPPPP